MLGQESEDKHARVCHALNALSLAANNQNIDSLPSLDPTDTTQLPLSQHTPFYHIVTRLTRFSNVPFFSILFRHFFVTTWEDLGGG